MKFVQIAILGLVGESAALPMLTGADDCTVTTTAGKCNGGVAFDEATGKPNECARTMRGQATKAVLYANNDNFGVWADAVK